MKNVLKRTISVFLAFVMVCMTGIPTQTLPMRGIPTQVQAAEEMHSEETQSTDVSREDTGQDGDVSEDTERTEDESVSERTEKTQDVNQSESASRAEDESATEDTERTEDEKVSERETDTEEETVSEDETLTAKTQEETTSEDDKLLADGDEDSDTSIKFEHMGGDGKGSGKYIKFYDTVDVPLTVDGEYNDSDVAFSKVVYGTNNTMTVDGMTFVTASLVSKYGKGIKSVWYEEGPKADIVKVDGGVSGGGWESLRILWNEDGTVSFKDSCLDQYITVKDNNLVGGVIPRGTAPTNNEKFILHLGKDFEVPVASGLSADENDVSKSAVNLTWNTPQNLFTGVEIYMKKADENDSAYKKVGTTKGENNYKKEGLTGGTEYHFKIRTFLQTGEGEYQYSEYSSPITVKTKDIDKDFKFEHKESGSYIKTYANQGTPLTVDGSADDEEAAFSRIEFGEVDSTSTIEDGLTFTTASPISKKHTTGVCSVTWTGASDNKNGATADIVKTETEKKSGNGWESLRILGNGDGTVSFKDSYFDQYITVDDEKYLACRAYPRETTTEELTDKDKFVIHYPAEYIPKAAGNLSYDADEVSSSTVDLTWENPKDLFTGIEISVKKAGESAEQYKTLPKQAGGGEKYTVTDLDKDTEYNFKIRAVLTVTDNDGKEQTFYSDYSSEITVTTLKLSRPDAPQNVRIKEQKDGKVIVSWDTVKGNDITGYKIYGATGGFVPEEKRTELEEIQSEQEKARQEFALPEQLPKDFNKYDFYYVTAVRTNGDETAESKCFDAVSLTAALFGDHTVIFSPDDDVKEVDKFLKELFDKQNDFDNDAQFKGEQWQIYFKPGDYTETSCMHLGFYTSFNGLGKTPYDVKLNNIAIPAYLPFGALGSSTPFNATCNFWRSAENLSVMDTGNDQGKADKYFECYRPDAFNWAVAQAAPLRRVYSERSTHYDWNWGWASGGYVADCLLTGIDKDGNGAGTGSGQQFFTRNSEVKENIFGTTLNNFFMGVEAANNLNDRSGYPLRKEVDGKTIGYTNWGIGKTSDNSHQVVTEITETPKISEKPFLYLDDGEYKVFVPAVRYNVRGISWGEGKPNDGMGAGKSLSLLQDFYIANPKDSAAKINEQIAKGKNIYFTPGIYHAEVPIVVDRDNAILLGTGMTSIIPDNDEMAMQVGDKNGIRIEGLIFDAGTSSKLLLQVGTKGTHKNHAANPIILQDLFFRVGGTTDVLTKADDALEINSDDVICDHFWIWRADHGAGVEWYGNESKHGLIVNGDRVKCYALFNEHFQEYHTLWNGEEGETYFYQNETCYDPISQEAWMSHNGTVKGYSSYKVSNDVEKHYAVGLGVYNVFIYTGKTYGADEIGIELDNAIEVPNKDGVMVENACTQTFANDKKADGSWYPQSGINHIINGIGGRVSSGEGGEGWSRKYVLYYHNGEAEYGRETDPKTFGVEGKDERNKFIGTEKVTVEAPADEEIDLSRITKLYDQFSDKTEKDYTANSWKRADMTNVLMKTNEAINMGKRIQAEIADGKKYSQSDISELQTQINKARTVLEAASEKLVYIREAVWTQETYKDFKSNDYEPQNWSAFDTARTQLDAVLKEAKEADPTTTKDVYFLQKKIDKAAGDLRDAAGKLTPTSTISATGVELNETKVSLHVNSTAQLMAKLKPTNATNQKVAWSSSDDTVASVDENGKVTAKDVGTATITVTTDDGSHTAECEVTVTGVTGITLNESSITLRVGEDFQLEATEEIRTKARSAAQWSSSDEKIATVDGSGKVTAVAVGKARITVRMSGYMAVCEVRVADKAVISEMPADKAVSGSDIVLSFSKSGNEDYKKAITGISVDAKSLGNTEYKIGEGNTNFTITLDKSLFTVPADDKFKTFTIKVQASPYQENVIRQTVYSDNYWNSTWLEEFDGDKLNLARWSYQEGTGEDYVEDGWGNDEKQYYTKNNLKVEDGELVITAKKESKGGKDYTSARIWTMEDGETAKFSQTYGRIEAKIKLAGGKGYEGIWPAFWMLPVEQYYGGWPVSGEIDIMEAKGREADKVSGTVHFGNPYQYKNGEYQFEGFDINEYHVYAVEWEADEIRWYVDDNCYYTLSSKDWYSQKDGGSKNPSPAPFDRDFYIVLNMAVGGTFDGGKTPSDDKLPVDMKVDYVRVYQTNKSTDPTPPDLADKTALNSLLKECESLKEEDYTEESWKKYEEALNAAKAVAENEAATEEEIQNVIDNLEQAKSGLKEKEQGTDPTPPDLADKTALNSLLKEYEFLKEEDYTEESWKKYEEALNAAKAVAENEAATQDEIQTAIDNLTQAKEGLKEKEPGTDPTPPAEERTGLWAVNIPKQTYTGAAIKPTVTVYNGKTMLTLGKDYTVSYKNNKNATDKALAIIKGKGNYGGSITKEFVIDRKSLADEDIVIPNLTVKAPKAGKSLKPAPVVTRNGKKLSKKDYQVKGGDVTAAGEYTVTVEGTGNYTGQKEIIIYVAGEGQVPMSAVKVTAGNCEYTGEAAKPEITVKYGKDILEQGTDYEVLCSSTESGAATAVIKGIGGTYIGEKTVTFQITGTVLKAGDVTLEPAAVYTGSAIEPEVHVAGADPKDYIVSYDKNVQTGTAVVTVKGIGRYAGTVKKTFKITAFDLGENAGGRLEYKKDGVRAPYAKGGSKLNASDDLKLTFAGEPLTEGVDYTLAYTANKKLGDGAVVKIKGKGNFKGMIEVPFTVVQQELSNLTDISAKDVLQKNAAKYDKTVPTIKDLDGKALKKGTDFEVTGYEKTDGTPWDGAPSVGDTVCIVVEGKEGGAYSGKIYAKFRIIADDRDISKAKITVKDQVYTGEAIVLTKDQITVTLKGATLNADDYEIVSTGYSANINKGKGKVTIHGTGNYGGTKVAAFKIDVHGLDNMAWYEELLNKAKSWLGK